MIQQAAANYLKTDAGSLDPHAILREPASVLLGVSQDAAEALESIDVITVYDLALSRVFRNAAQLLKAGSSQRDAFTGFGAPPADAVDGDIDGIALEQLKNSKIEILSGIGATNAGAIEDALDVRTIRDLALWPPYLAAGEIMAQAFFPAETRGYDPEAPADLVPRSGEYPTERIQYTTLVLDEIQDDVAQLQPLDTAGPIDISPAAAADFGFKRPGIGALLTFDQSWYAQGVALGHLLHSVALAPGESTRIAMVDWSRRTSASTTESLSESEDLTNATQHSRALSEVQQAVATEAQSGFSKTTSSSSSAEGGGGFGLGLGPLTIGATASGASSSTTAESFSSSFGRRELEASMTQNVMDSTQQHATAVRNRRASIVREVSQSERETVSTRVVANYNHMHAMSVQYYEVIQIYRVTVRLSQAQKCIFIPMKLIDFKNHALIEKYRLVLARVALGERIRRLLTSDYGVVAITPNTPRVSAHSISTALVDAKLARFSTIAAKTSLAAAAAGAAGTDTAQPASAAQPVAAAQPAVTLTAANAAVALRGWDLMQVSDVSRIVDRAIVRRDSGELSLPDDVALLGFFLRNAQLGTVRVELRDGTFAPHAISGGTATITTPTGIGEIEAISLSNPSDKDVRATFVLQLDYLGRRFSLDVPIDLRGNQALAKVISFGATKASKELVEHLEANRLHYSQAVFRSLDAATIALLLSPYRYDGVPVTQLIDPLPVAAPGNYLVFRTNLDDGASSAGEDDGEDAAAASRKAWRKWLKDHGISRARVREAIVPLPSGGVFAEAVLGRFNSAEKLDITRFWNWQDSPIPLLPTDIAPIQLASRAQPENLVPGQFSQPLVNIVNPTQLPDPAGVGAVLTAIQNGNMFRDMSGLAATIGLARAGLEATSEGAGRAGAQAGANLVTAAQKEVEMAKTAVAAISAMKGNPNAQAGSGANISGQGALLNHGRNMDSRGVRGGNNADSPPSSGAPAPSEGGGSSGESSGGSAGDVEDASPPSSGGSGGGTSMPVDWMPNSYEASTFDALNWPGLGGPARMMLASYSDANGGGSGSGSGSASGSSAEVKAIVKAAADTAKPAADRATAAVQAIIDKFYAADGGLVSSIVYDAGTVGLMTTREGSGATAKGKLTVGDDFLKGVSESFMGRRVIQVGHELEHVRQYRSGMTGSGTKDEREFLAHNWGALRANPAGTKAIPTATRLKMVDAAVGYYLCLADDKKTAHKDKYDTLLEERKKYDGKNGNAAVAAPTSCTRI